MKSYNLLNRAKEFFENYDSRPGTHMNTVDQVEDELKGQKHSKTLRVTDRQKSSEN